MNIVQVHNYYKHSGGEDIVLEQERDLINSNGGTVYQFIKNNKNMNGLWDYLRVGLSTRYSRRTYREFSNFLESKEADVVHVHNFFPIISPSIFDCTTEKSIPSVMTLHNYRLLHPNGLMLHNGEIDERSLRDSAFRCVLDGVYRNSIIQTAVVADMIEYHRKHKTWDNKVNGFIALTEFAKSKFIEGGLPADKIYVKPNFVVDPLIRLPNIKKSERRGYLFVGRISEEKGIEELIQVWNSNKISTKLTVIGDGPLRDKLEGESSSDSNILWLGKQPNKIVYKWLAKVKALIFPSTWYEGFPMTILEAFSVGCPVICSDIGSQHSIVKNGYSGLHFKIGDGLDLMEKVERLEKNKDLVDYLGENGRREYENYYTPQKNYELLTNIYQEVLT